METKRHTGNFSPMVIQWFIKGQGGVLTVILPLSLGCRDPNINTISRHGIVKIFHFTGYREGVPPFLALEERWI